MDAYENVTNSGTTENEKFDISETVSRMKLLLEVADTCDKENT